MSYTPTEWESTDVVTATRMNALEQAVGDMNMSYTPNTWSDGDILSAEKMNALEQAVASGGGGSSDFSTAKVTLSVSGNAGLFLPLAFTFDPPIGSGVTDALYCPYLNQAGTFTVGLYKGSCVLFRENQYFASNVSVTGDCEYYSNEGIIIITGDCTITIS